MNNDEIYEEFGFIISDRDFMNSFGHILTKPFLSKYISIMGNPEDHEHLPTYYEKLSYALLGYQISITL